MLSIVYITFVLTNYSPSVTSLLLYFVLIVEHWVTAHMVKHVAGRSWGTKPTVLREIYLRAVKTTVLHEAEICGAKDGRILGLRDSWWQPEDVPDGNGLLPMRRYRYWCDACRFILKRGPEQRQRKHGFQRTAKDQPNRRRSHIQQRRG